jgi:predicted PurR-regulated permease PerM
MNADVKSIKNSLTIIVCFLIIYSIAILKSILIPLALALFFVLLIEPVLHWLMSKKMSFALSVILVLIVSIYLINGVGSIIYGTGQSIVEQQDKLYQQLVAKINPMLAWIKETIKLELPLVGSDTPVDDLWQLISKEWLLTASGSFAGALSNIGQLVFMTSLYFFALLGGIMNYQSFLNYVSAGDESERLLKTFESVKTSITTYVKVKFLVSLGTGSLFSIICLIFDVDFALFWGFLAFSFNFIPTVGSFIATLPAVLLGIIQIESAPMVVLFVLCLVAVQIVFGNILEPKLVGRSFAINTVFVILSLVFWGYLWGIVGMVLSTPILVLVKAILDQFPEYQVISRLMGVSEE